MLMENLEKSWHFKIVISRPGKVMEKNLNHKFWKSHGNVLSHVDLHSLK